MEQESTFSVRSVYREAKEYFKKHFYYFFSAFLVIGLIGVGFNAITPDIEKFSFLSLMLIGGVIAIAIAIVGAVVQMFLQIKVMRATLAVIRDSNYKPEFNQLFVREGDGRARVWKYFVTYLLMGLFVLGGFILLIIPGIYIAIRMSFAVYIIIDKNGTPMEAIRESWELTRGHVWKLFRFSVIAGFFFLITIIGFIVTIPFMQVLQLTLYNRLQKSKEVSPAVPQM